MHKCYVGTNARGRPVFFLCGVLAICLSANAWGALRAGWMSQDIGTNGGSASESGGVWDVTGDGADIWRTSDAFHFAYVLLSGNAEIIARVTDTGTHTDYWSKGGVMIRETLDMRSAHAFVALTGGRGNGLIFQVRPETSVSCTAQADQPPDVTPPHWIKLVRDDDDFSAYRSPDGVSWTQQGTTQTVVMSRDVYVGLAVTSHRAGRLRTYTFTDVSVRAEAALAPVPTDGETIGGSGVSLVWTPGTTAASHDIYFDENYDDVLAGTGGSFRGNQTGTWFPVGLDGFLYPNGLELGNTYYWRVDEIEADGTTKHAGKVWCFSTPGLGAREPQPLNGAKLIRVNSGLSWTAGYGAMLHKVYLADDYDTLVNTTEGETLPTTSYDPGDMEYDTTYYWRVDEFDGNTTHKGDVWSFTTIRELPVYDASLIGWWKTDSSTGDTAIDWSGYAHHGAFYGDPEWVSDWWGSGLKLDGDGDYVDIGSVGISGAVPRSIVGWVKASTIEIPDGTTVFGFANGEGWNTGYWEVEVDDGWYKVHMGPLYSWEACLLDTEWHHLAFTKEIDEGCTYVDGELLGCLPGGSYIGTVDYMRIGARAGIPSPSYYPGIVDDIRVYNRSLALEEIRQIAAPCVVNLDDFAALAGQWQQRGDGLTGDLDQDQDVDCDDLRLLAENWLDSCCAPMIWPLK